MPLNVICVCLEFCVYSYAHSMLADTWNIEVGKAAYIVYLEYLKDIGYTKRKFHIGRVSEKRTVGRSLTYWCGEYEQIIAVDAIGNILGAKTSIESLEIDHFAPS